MIDTVNPSPGPFPSQGKGGSMRINRREMRYYETRALARGHRKNPTEAESYFWEKVRGRRLFGLKINRQFLIQHSEIMGNKLYYISDFHNCEHKLIIEIDGGIHLIQQEYDILRENNIKALGYRILRFTNDEVLYKWEEVERKIGEFLTNHSAH
jgi:very-short-patch-repair endonuclease